jgi:hypothetical protein
MRSMGNFLWHLFGAVSAALFAIGSASFVTGNWEIRLSQLGWAVITIIGLAGLLGYVRWVIQQRQRR